MAVSARDLRIIICEDEYMLAVDLAEQLEQLGAVVVATCARLDQLMTEINRPDFSANAAVLDVSLFGNPVYAAVPLLQQRNVAVVFHTGYVQRDLPAEFAQVPMLSKPGHAADVVRALLAELA